MKNLGKYLPGSCLQVPPLGQDIVDLAESQGKHVDEMVSLLLQVQNAPLVPLTVQPGVKRNFVWVSGHCLNLAVAEDFGPRRQYLSAIVGQQLGATEVKRRTLFTGSTGKMIRDWLGEFGLEDPRNVYLTSVLKTQALLPKKYLQSWVQQQRAITTMELILARPKFVLSLGAPATKFFYGKKKFKLQSVEGRWVQMSWDLRTSEDEEKTRKNQYVFYVMPCTNPAALEYEQRKEEVERIRGVLRSFVQTVNAGIADDMTGETDDVVDIDSDSGWGVGPDWEDTESMSPWADAPKPALVSTTRQNVDEYPVVRNLQQLRAVLAEMGPNAVKRLVGVDAEWQGSHPQNKGAFLRCVQLGWKPGHAFVMSLTNTKGEPVFENDHGEVGPLIQWEAFAMVQKAFDVHRLRTAGFFYGADHEWLAYHGLDLMPYYEAAESPELARDNGGMAVELAVAAVDELSTNNLETVRWRYTDVGDYFNPFNEFKQQATLGASASAKAVQEAGYGWIPDEYLYPYAGGDADVTLQGALNIMAHLDSDANGRNVWLPYWLAHRASPVVAEIMRTGVPFSQQRCAELGINYTIALQRVLRVLKPALNWPTFNIDNWRHLCEAMYGTRYSPMRDKATGARKRMRPPGGKTLALEPVIDNDPQRPMVWSEVRAAGLEELKTPSTGAKALGILRKNEAVEARRAGVNGIEVVSIPPPKELTQIFYAKSIRQVQKNFIGVPLTHPETGKVWFTQGYGLEVCDDGYLRCFISQTKETGRWSAAMPNLHNLPKRKENNYKNALGDLYLGWLRTCFVAPPGYILVECDYASAELFMLAIASGDEVLWSHCQRNLLPEEDPNFIDPHASLCVDGFKLACLPNKTGLKSLGKAYLRDVAKCVAEGEMLGTSLGWVPVERFADGVREGESMPYLGTRGLQSDIGLTPLQAVSYIGVRDCLRVELYGGYSITTTPEHRHYVLRQDSLVDYAAAEDLKYGDYCLVKFESYAGQRVPELPESLKRLMGEMGSQADTCKERLTQEDAIFLGLAAGSQGKALVDKTGRCLLQLGDINVSTQRQVVTLLNQYLGEHAALGDSQDPSRVYIHSGLWLEFGQALAATGWDVVSTAVFLWPHWLRACYCYGLTIVSLTGIRQSLGLRYPVEVAMRYQQLMQSLGWRVHRVKSRLDNTARISAYGQLAARFFDCCVSGDLETVVDLLEEPEAVTYPVLPAWIRRLAGMHQIHLPTSHGEVPYAESAQWISHLVGCVEQKAYRLTVEQREELRRVRDCLDAGYVPILVERVVSAGRQKVYDFQTNAERGRLLTVNGVATHNSVIYGWAYGRMAPAIQVGAKEEGIDVTLDETQRLLDTLASKYYLAAEYLEAAAARVKDGFLYTPMGRVRRCPDSTDRLKLSGYQREFKNAPIQGGVADVVNTAAYNLRRERTERGMSFHIVLQIHDAFMFMVPYHEVYELCNKVIPKAMSRDVPIVPFHLDGTRVASQQPKFMGYGIDLSFRWGESASAEELAEVGILTERIERLE